MLKVQIELHKEIKKNGPARCLRAALWRFGQLSPYVRPSKGRGHVQSLFPSLLLIAKREEENVHETLSLSLANIFRVLGVFTNDNEIKVKLTSLLTLLSDTLVLASVFYNLTLFTESFKSLPSKLVI